MYVAVGILALLLLALAVVWIERRPIATHFLKGEFERRGTWDDVMARTAHDAGESLDRGSAGPRVS